jgi:hypothetical protein
MSTESTKGEKKDRFFKIVPRHGREPEGALLQSRFKSNGQPKAAATKALRKIIEISLAAGGKTPATGDFTYYTLQKKNGKYVYTFAIQETTRSRTNKQPLTYSGYRELLEEPATYEIKTADGSTKTITNMYKTYLTKVKTDDVAPVDSNDAGDTAAHEGDVEPPKKKSKAKTTRAKKLVPAAY